MKNHFWDSGGSKLNQLKISVHAKFYFMLVIVFWEAVRMEKGSATGGTLERHRSLKIHRYESYCVLGALDNLMAM